MKVLHIVAGNLDEGAAQGAYILHEHLVDQNIDSRLLTNSFKTTGYKNIHSISAGTLGQLKTSFRMKLDNSFKLLYQKKQSLKFSPGLVGYDFTNLDGFKKADIIHLHWVCNGLFNVKLLNKIKKPIVWTLRDMWPMTGGCHYSLDCDRYQTTCGKCPHLSSKKVKDLSSYLQKRKDRFYSNNITFVGISKWITEQAKKSSLLRDYKIETISNTLDLASFFPVPKNDARKYFDLPDDKHILLFGAQYLNSLYKGYDILIEILGDLDIKAEIVFFGRHDPVQIKNKNLTYRYLGFLDKEELRMAYSAADVFVSPSRMEAFGKTVAESMACGTPVVCFDNTGSTDIVEHQQNGYLAIPFSSDDVISGIKFLLNHPDNDTLSKSAMVKIKRSFDPSVISREYIDLYERLLK